jgi:hypothetical protein
MNDDQTLVTKLMTETGLGSSPCAIALEEAKSYEGAKALLAKHGAALSVVTIEARRKAVEESRAERAAATTDEERPHHQESASSLQPKEWCPRFKSWNTTSEAAEIGTLQHYAAETRDLSQLDDLQAEKVQMCLDFVDNRLAELKTKFPDARLETEVYGQIDDVEWPTMNERSTSGGFVDVVIPFDEGRQVEIWDYKFGQWAVEPPDNNLQGIVYVLNHRHRYPNLQRATVGFLMPYLDKIQHHTFTAEDFPGLYVRVKRLVAIRQHSRNLDENPSFNTCMWCANIGNCKRVSDAVYRAASKFSPLKVPADPDPNKISSASDISAWVQFADVCKAYGSAVRERCTEKVLDDKNLCPESHDLVNQPVREIQDNAAWIQFLQDNGIPQSVLDRVMKVTLGEAEKAFSAMAERGQKTAFAKEMLEKASAAGLLAIGQTKIFLRAKRQSAE